VQASVTVQEAARRAKDVVVEALVLYICPASGVEKPCSGGTIVKILLNGAYHAAESVYIEEGTALNSLIIHILYRV